MQNWSVLFVGLGPLGKMILADFVSRRLGTVAGLVDINPRLAGQRGRDIVPGASDQPVKATIADAVQSVDPKTISAAVLATSSDLAQCMPSLRDLLSRGVRVVSTCEELLWPWLRHEAHASELDELCRRHSTAVVGTGVNPGFLMDTLPVALTAVCRDVRRVRVERYQDATTRRIPFQQKIGATLSEDEFARRVEAKTLRHVGLGESLHFLAHYLSLGVTRWNETIAPVRAERSLTCSLGEIKPGGISGVRQTAHGWNAAGDEIITLTFQATIGQENPRDRVVIESDPPIESVIPGAVHGDAATSAITLNTIPRLAEAPPGLHTMATLPMTRFVR